MSDATLLRETPLSKAVEETSPPAPRLGKGPQDRPLIQVSNVTKAFGPKLAVNGISFSVERGEVLGFLGPNRTGNSTSIRMTTGFIPPSDGTITIGGYDMLANPLPAKRLIGYLPENAPAYSDMTVWSFLSFCAELSGLRAAERKKAI